MSDVSEFEAKCRNAHEKMFLASRPQEFQDLFRSVRDYTMLSRERLFDLWESVRHVQTHRIPGDVVEVGCWRGGGLAVALRLVQPERHERLVWGFDTFEGHGEPGVDELDVWGNGMRDRWLREMEANGSWCGVGMSEVRDNVASVCGSLDRLRLVKGRAELTIPVTQVDRVSVLRLDADWYEPTSVALRFLWPRLSSGGVLIVDDYGHHSGAARAVDEFFGKLRPKFTWIDYSCVAAVKP